MEKFPIDPTHENMIRMEPGQTFVYDIDSGPINMRADNASLAVVIPDRDSPPIAKECIQSGLDPSTPLLINYTEPAGTRQLGQEPLELSRTSRAIFKDYWIRLNEPSADNRRLREVVIEYRSNQEIFPIGYAAAPVTPGLYVAQQVQSSIAQRTTLPEMQDFGYDPLPNTPEINGGNTGTFGVDATSHTNPQTANYRALNYPEQAERQSKNDILFTDISEPNPETRERMRLSGLSAGMSSKPAPGKSNEDSDDIILGTGRGGPYETYGVFDGVSSGEQSAVAARKASNAIFGVMSQMRPTEYRDEALLYAKEAIAAAHEVAQNAGGETTATALRAYEDIETGLPHFVFMHVGDSRLYRIRDRKISQLTTDHSYAMGVYGLRSGINYAKSLQKLIDESESRLDLPDFIKELVNDGASPELAADFKDAFLNRRRITSALGMKDKGPVRAQIGTFSAQPGDRFVLTSDGVHDILAKRRLMQVVTSKHNDQEAAQGIIELSDSLNFGFKAKDDTKSVAVLTPYFELAA